MVWLKIAVLVATITDGDIPTFPGEWLVVVATKMAGNVCGSH